jgi:soluble lytic murein transglycosylase-like protein
VRGPSVVACLAIALFIGHASLQAKPSAFPPGAAPPPAPDALTVEPADAAENISAVADLDESPSATWGSNRTSVSTAGSFAYAKNHPATPLPALAFAALGGTDGWADDEGRSFASHDTPMDTGAGRMQRMSRGGLCSAIVAVARANDLPITFFANLIWQESSFQSKTISPAGALGIAQFVPETAIEYGLMNPFEPVHALFAAGKLLRKLNDRFGNLGLAAAAYNAGPQRVQAWRAERRTLPGETRAYVIRITGRAAEQWLWSEIRRDPEATLMPAMAPCTEVQEDVKAQGQIVRVSRLMSELAAATAPMVPSTVPLPPPKRVAAK